MNKPIFIYSAAPAEPSKLKRFFESGENSPMDLLSHPGHSRYAGWNLETLDMARIIKGEYLEVKNGDRKTIHLYEDGSLIAQVLADQSFLGWGKEEEDYQKNPGLNTLAIIEFTLNFVNLYQKILVNHFENPPTKIIFKLQIKNAFLDLEDEKSRLFIIPYGVNTWGWVTKDERYYAKENEMDKKLEISADEIKNKPAHVAYKLVEKIFTWFGSEANKIAYTKGEGENKEIDLTQIK